MKVVFHNNFVLLALLMGTVKASDVEAGWKDDEQKPIGEQLGARSRKEYLNVGQVCRTSDSLDFVVTWSDDQDQSGFYQIKLAGFTSQGAKTLEDMTVNSVARGQQLNPQVALNDRGQSVVVWEDDKDKNWYYQIHARGINADGSELFSDIVVNVEASGDQLRPDIDITPAVGWFNNGFVVVWADDADKNGFWQIYVRGFDYKGMSLFEPVSVNAFGDTYPTYHIAKPQVATSQNGNFVVVWQDDSDFNTYYQIKARGFYRWGQHRFGPITINEVAKGQQLKPKLDMALNGDFVVVWEDDSNDNDVYQIYAAGFNSKGQRRFSDIVVNVKASGQQLKPDVAVDPNGNFFVVVWEDDNDKNRYYQIYMRGFNKDGTQLFATTTVNTVSKGQQLKPRVDIGRDGTIIVVFLDDYDENKYWEIFARGFRPDGTQLFGPITVNEVATGQQLQAAVAARKTFQKHPSIRDILRHLDRIKYQLRAISTLKKRWNMVKKVKKAKKKIKREPLKFQFTQEVGAAMNALVSQIDYKVRQGQISHLEQGHLLAEIDDIMVSLNVLEEDCGF